LLPLTPQEKALVKEGNLEKRGGNRFPIREKGEEKKKGSVESREGKRGWPVLSLI